MYLYPRIDSGENSEPRSIGDYHGHEWAASLRMVNAVLSPISLQRRIHCPLVVLSAEPRECTGVAKGKIKIHPMVNACKVYMLPRQDQAIVVLVARDSCVRDSLKEDEDGVALFFIDWVEE